MPIIKRRLDICGREKTWEYTIEAAGRQYQVTARQLGRLEPVFECTCGMSTDGQASDNSFFADAFLQSCNHIAEAQRDLSLARQAAAHMMP